MRTSSISKENNGFCEFCEQVKATLRFEVLDCNPNATNWTLSYLCWDCLHGLVVDDSRIDITKKSK